MIDGDILKLPSRLIETFSSVAASVLPVPLRNQVPILSEYFRKTILTPFYSSLLPPLDIEIKSSILSVDPESTYKMLLVFLRCLHVRKVLVKGYSQKLDTYVALESIE